MHKITLHAKDFMGSAVLNGKIVGTLAVSTIVAQKFIDLKAIAEKFNITIESGSIIEKVIDHQGAIKVIAVLIVLHLTKNKSIGKNDLFKWAMIGLMFQGTLQEINQLSGDKAGQIGTKELDEEMKKAAEYIDKNMNGNQEYIGANPTEEFIPSVNGNPTQMFIPSVQGNEMLENGTGVAGGEEESDYSFLSGDEDNDY